MPSCKADIQAHTVHARTVLLVVGASVALFSSNVALAQPQVGFANTLYAGQGLSMTNSYFPREQLYVRVDEIQGTTQKPTVIRDERANRPVTSLTPVWGDITKSTDSTTAAAVVAYGLQVAWDYFSDAHGWKGMAGDGGGTQAYVHANANKGYAPSVLTKNKDQWVMYLNDEGIGLSDPRWLYSPFTSVDVIGNEFSTGSFPGTIRISHGKMPPTSNTRHYRVDG